MKYKIKLPVIVPNNMEIDSQTRALLTNDLEKGGILAKVLVFVQMNEPTTTTNLAKKLSEYYFVDYTRSDVYRALSKLTARHLVNSKSTADISAIPPSDRTEKDEEIMSKHYAFLKNIPQHFQKNFTSVNYFWLSNGEGYKFLSHCCKILGFECTKMEDKKENGNTDN